MTTGRTAIAWSVAGVLAVAAAVYLLVGSDGGAEGTSVPDHSSPGAPSTPGVAESGAGGASPSPEPTETLDPVARHEADRALLTDPSASSAAGPAELRAVVARWARGEWRDLVSDAWRDRVTAGVATWPVYVGTATISSARVELDVAIATEAEAGGEVVLRLLPAAAALGDNDLSVDVRIDGQTLDTDVDRAAARVVVPIPATATDEVVLDVDLSYDLTGRNALVSDGTPASIGLLARSDGVTALGHWLPLVTTADASGPMERGGDVGGFPAGVFSLVIAHDGHALVTGGDEIPADDACHRPEVVDCTWVRGLGLRDVGAVLLDDPARAEAPWGAGTATAWAHAPDLPPDRLQDLANESAQGLDALADHLGTLPWHEVDVVQVPIRPGALGMEFPGIVWLDPAGVPEEGPELGSYVLAHELGHQWFHALVGNSSLVEPVVDEATAQYLSYLVFADLFGQGAADALDARSISGRHDAAVADGVPDELPAMALGEFASPRSYGANVYGRGGAAWVEAEAAAGRDPVVSVLRALVDRYGLGEATARQVVDVAAELAPEVAEVLRAGWGVTPDE